LNAETFPSSLEPKLALALTSLSRAGVSYVVLRGFDPLAELATSIDIDVFIPEEELAAAVPILESNGWLRRASQTGRYPHSFFDAWDHPSGGVRSLDVVTELCYGADLLTLRGGAAVLTTAVDVGGVRTPAPWYHLFTLALHVVLDKGVLSVNNARRLEAAVAAISRDREGADAFVRAFGEDAKGFLDAFVHAVTKPGCDLRVLTIRARRLACLSPQRIKSRFSSLGRRIRQLVRPVARIAIIGIDGSGKSTLIDALTNAPGTLRIWRGYLGSNGYRTLPARFLAQRLARYHGPDAAIEDQWKRIWANLGTLWLPVELATRMAIAEHRSEVVLYDRFPIGQDDGSPSTLWGRCVLAYVRFWRALLPKPDLVILLDGDDRVIWERKREFSFESHQRTQRRYRAIVNGLRGEHVIVRTDCSLAQSVTNLRSAIAGSAAVRRKLYGRT